jgi:hypothetical protein
LSEQSRNAPFSITSSAAQTSLQVPLSNEQSSPAKADAGNKSISHSAFTLQTYSSHVVSTRGLIGLKSAVLYFVLEPETGLRHMIDIAKERNEKPP